MEEEKRKISELAERLDEERRRRTEAETRLQRERKGLEKERNTGFMLQELEFETSTLKKSNSGLEAELNKTKQKLNNLDDVLNENRDLQEAVLKKDNRIQHLETSLTRVRGEDEARFQKTLERLRGEYEIMAKASVSTKLRKINNYIGEKNRRQEEMDKDRDHVTGSIQTDLEERLSSTLAELGAIKNKLKKTEEDLSNLRVTFEKREKQLRAEQHIRRQLEEQLDKLLNQRILSQQEIHETRNSLESPYPSPHHPKYRSSSSLLFK